MSLAEEMLATMSVSDISAPRLVNEGTIDVDESRRVIVPPELKTIAVTNDSNVETVTFKCIRYWDGHDLSTFSIYLNYVLPDRTTGTYVVEHLATSADHFFFDWTITKNITKKSGSLTFGITAVRTKLGDDGSWVVDKQWSSLPNSDCQIASGLDISNVPDEEESADILAQMSAILQQMQSDVTSWIKPAVVQEMGTSTEKVMSQYAVTTALENNKKDFSSKISRNSKLITNVIKGYSDEMFVTGDMNSVAERIVPEDALPYAEVKKIYGGAYTDSNGLLQPRKALRVESYNPVDKEILDAALDTSDMVDTMTVEKLSDGSIEFTGTTDMGWYRFATVTIPEGTWEISIRESGGVIAHDFTISDSANGTSLNGRIEQAAEERTMDLYVSTDGANEYSIFIEMLDADPVPIATLEIPEAVRNIDGYGFTASNYIDLERRVVVLVRKNINNTSVLLDTPEVIDVSQYIGEDNFIEVVPNGVIRVIRDTGEIMSCKCEIEFMVKGV